MIAARDRSACLSLAILLVAAAFPAGAAPAAASADRAGRADQEVVVRFATVNTSSLPRDFVDPEGRTRWDLRALTTRDRFTRRIGAAPFAAAGAGVPVRLADDTTPPYRPGAVPSIAGAARPGPRSWRFVDPTGGDGALRLLRPDAVKGALLPGTRAQYRVDQEDEADGSGSRGRTRLLLTSTIAGLGWLHLPSGPREVVLERLLVLRAPEGDPPTGAALSANFVPDRLVHRFIDPRAGVVAEISGPPDETGRGRFAVAEASVAEEVLA